MQKKIAAVVVICLNKHDVCRCSTDEEFLCVKKAVKLWVYPFQK